jgi:hypothetical protein
MKKQRRSPDGQEGSGDRAELAREPSPHRLSSLFCLVIFFLRILMQYLTMKTQIKSYLAEKNERINESDRALKYSRGRRLDFTVHRYLCEYPPEYQIIPSPSIHPNTRLYRVRVSDPIR